MAKKAATTAEAPKAATGAPGKPATKGEIYTKLATKTGLSKKQVSTVFDALTELDRQRAGQEGPRLFVVPGLLKLKVIRKPATKAKTGINPFTKQPMIYKAKPARNVVKACRSSRSRKWSERPSSPAADACRVCECARRIESHRAGWFPCRFHRRGRQLSDP